MKDKQIKEMARAMSKCHKRKMTCDECIAESKKMFGGNQECALIEYATKLYKEGYRKQSGVVKGFAVKLTALLNKAITKTNVNPYDNNEDTVGYINGLESAKIDLRILAKEYGVEVEQ